MTDLAEETPKDAIYHSGKTGEELYNYYSTMFQRATYEAFEETDKQPFVRARSGYAGMGQYPTCWPGDPNPTFNAMANVLRGGLNLGLSGVPFWMNYVSSHMGRPNDELMMRWSQCAMFASHADPGENNPLTYDDDQREIYRRYATLRYRLIPYIYSYAHRATRTGLPLMRPLFLEFEDDRATYDIEDQFIFGEELLVAPILKASEDGSGTVEREIYLPETTWIDFWTGAEYQGPGTITYEAPLDTLPLFVRADSIVPMGPEREFITEESHEPITFDAYLDSSASFDLYGESDPVSVHLETQRQTVVANIDRMERPYVLKLNDLGTITEVTVEDTELTRRDDRASFIKIERGWYESDDGDVYVKPNVTQQVEIRLYPK